MFYLLHDTALAEQGEFSFTVSPPIVEVNPNPGESIDGTIRVRNNTGAPLEFRIQTRDFIVEDQVGTPNILPEGTFSDQFSAASWISILPDLFTIPPRETVEVSYGIDAPSDARAGGHYAAVLFAPIQDVNVESTGTSVQPVIGALFYVGVAGDVREKAKISMFKPKESLLQRGPVELKTIIQNNGDLHIKPIVNIKVIDLFGKVIETQKLDEFNIFPTAKRSYLNTLGTDRFMLGRYKVELTGTYGKANNLPLVAVTTFWVLPWKVGTIAVLIIVILILSIILAKRRSRLSTS